MTITRSRRASPARPAVRGRAPWVALVVLLVFAAMVLLIAAIVHDQVSSWGELPVHVVINGRELLSGIDFRSIGFGHAVVIAFALLVVLIVGAGVVGLGMLLGFGVPLFVIAALVIALALPAVLLIVPLVLLLRWALRDKPMQR